MSLKTTIRTALAASTVLASTSLIAFGADVTSQRLMNPDKEPQNWLMVNKDYSSHRYSELDQINKDNVKNLRVAFAVSMGGISGVGFVPLSGHQSTPLVNDGFMYVVNGFDAVYRIDVRDPANASQQGRHVQRFEPRPHPVQGLRDFRHQRLQGPLD
jgi:alcohol dehydrogenase (cytochrome c)